MYLVHFGLNELPFSITPDTTYFMNRAGHQDALNVLLVALRSGEGFVKVVGEVGVGKTLLCRKLMNSLGPEYVTAYVHNPYIRPESLLFAIADELGISWPDGCSQHQLLKLLNESLLENDREGKRFVVCLDEVQAMPVQTLEALRLLTNLETEKSKLLQVVLFGQPELDRLLNQPSVRQLRQRITYSYRLLPLNKVAMKTYVRYRLEIAGNHDMKLLTDRALDSVYVHSNGIPRLINIITHKALICAYGEGVKKVTHRHVEQAVKDMEEIPSSDRPGFMAWLQQRTAWLFGALCLAVFAGGIVHHLYGLF